jgi:hypothetical protein
LRYAPPFPTQTRFDAGAGDRIVVDRPEAAPLLSLSIREIDDLRRAGTIVARRYGQAGAVSGVRAAALRRVICLPTKSGSGRTGRRFHHRRDGRASP